MEKYKEILQKEGFKFIYEWTDQPTTEYPSHSHKGRVAFYVVKGSISVQLEGKIITLKPTERIDVPVGIEHKAKVGSNGCTYIVGEEIEGDS
jgi:quercetin dioxygenase-like cupin family protein